ncbi:hypothetical protein ACHAW6_014332 [Cyclotella cf. meneghiniana]
MEAELFALENDLHAWTLDKHKPSMNVFPMTCAFHLKHFPSGLVKKFKDRFCAHGDMQVEGVAYFETWNPMINLTMV